MGVDIKVSTKAFKIKATRPGTADFGEVGCIMQVYEIAPSLYLVDWRRYQGDLMTHFAFYQDIRARVSDVVLGGSDAPG